ncbi:MAG: hypothetical protein ACI37R_05315, partial [Candidatus Avigastranaerophilus sp.]
GCIIYGLLNGIFICINRLWQKLNIKMHKAVATSITFLSLTVIMPFIFIKDINQSFDILQLMFNFNFSLNNIVVDGFNIVFHDLRYPPYEFFFKINYLLLFAALYIVFFSQNSMQLAEKYIKSNNKFYNLILLIVFVYSVISMTKSNEFLYFAF